jgi:hypothetical protein
MRFRTVWSLALWLPAFLPAQPPAPTAPAPDEPVAVFTEHPRLLLRPARLRLLRRERERNSPRWQQFSSYVSNDAQMPETAFAQALYYQVAGNREAGRKAVAWASGSAVNLRQLALVFDWCQDLLTEPERRALATRIEQRMNQSGDESIPAQRDRVFAAIALFDHVPQTPNRVLDQMVKTWWAAKIAPALNAGRAVMSRDDAYPLWELLHAIRDNTNLDLRESARKFFKEYPMEHLISHYPAPFQGEENDYRIGASTNPGEPDLGNAALSRVAELAMVAYDNNAEESQYLQGWLMHDNFALRSPYGAPYEFLWANPYQPGLNYTNVPLVYHDATSGRLFVRSNWDDASEWFGCFDGVAQVFREGRRLTVDLKKSAAPLVFESAVIAWGPSASNLRVMLEDGQNAVILAGLAPNRVYQVEIDDEEVFEAPTDPAGILVLDLPHGKETGVRVHERAPLQ